MSELTRNLRKTVIIGESCRERFIPLSAPGVERLRQSGCILAGLSALTGDYEIYRPACPFHMVAVTLDGCGCYLHGGREILVTANTLIVAPAGEEHWFTTWGDRWRMGWLHLEDLPIWSHLKREAFLSRPSSIAEVLEDAMAAVVSESLARKVNSARIVTCHTELILAYLAREIGRTGGTRGYQEEKMDRLRNEINASLNLEWSTGVMAEFMNSSVTHFARLCREITGLTPLHMVTGLRMNRARELLLHSTYSVAQIAGMVGYENAFAFSTAFKKNAGSSPRDFRRQG